MPRPQPTPQPPQGGQAYDELPVPTRPRPGCRQSSPLGTGRPAAAGHRLRGTGSAAMESPLGRPGSARRLTGHRHPHLRHARRPRRAVRDPGRHLRPVPDHVDRGHRHLVLRTHGAFRTLPRSPRRHRPHLGRSPGPSHPRRLLLRRHARGAGRIRCSPGHHRRDAAGNRVLPDACSGRCAGRQHRPGGLRRDRHTDHHRRGADRHRL